MQAVFFDLDGTLADTAPDLAVALNRLRAEAGLARLPLDSIRPKVSGGTPAADLLSVKAAQCAFAGDARDDIVAGHKASTKTLVARFGYIDPSEDIAAWGADGEAHAPADIVHWLRSWTA